MTLTQEAIFTASFRAIFHIAFADFYFELSTTHLTIHIAACQERKRERQSLAQLKGMKREISKVSHPIFHFRGAGRRYTRITNSQSRSSELSCATAGKSRHERASTGLPRQSAATSATAPARHTQLDFVRALYKREQRGRELVRHH